MLLFNQSLVYFREPERPKIVPMKDHPLLGNVESFVLIANKIMSHGQIVLQQNRFPHAA